MSTRFATTEKADDGDDTDGFARDDKYPERWVADGATLAASHPIDYSQFLFVTRAAVGSKAARIAQAHVTGEMTSTFDVNVWIPRHIDFEIKTHLEPKLDSGGSCEMTYSITLFDTVNGGAIGTRRVTYAFKWNAATSSVDVSVNGSRVGSVAAGQPYEDSYEHSVKVRSGSYRLAVTYEASARADGKAELSGWMVAKPQ